MKSIVRNTLAVGLVACLFGAAAPAVAQSSTASTQDRSAQAKAPTKAKVGEKAPAFTLTDADGKSHNLNDWSGKTVVLQWINPDCPVCRRVMENGSVAKAYADSVQANPNVVWITVNSTHYMEPSKTKAYLTENKMPTLPALVDRDGTVGRMYGARTTPHIFVISDEGVLVYEGAFDDNASGTATEGITNYAVNAVKQLKAGETVAPANVRPYGCSVKYAGGGKNKRSRDRG